MLRCADAPPPPPPRSAGPNHQRNVCGPQAITRLAGDHTARTLPRERRGPGHNAAPDKCPAPTPQHSERRPASRAERIGGGRIRGGVPPVAKPWFRHIRVTGTRRHGCRMGRGGDTGAGSAPGTRFQGREGGGRASGQGSEASPQHALQEAAARLAAHRQQAVCGGAWMEDAAPTGPSGAAAAGHVTCPALGQAGRVGAGVAISGSGAEIWGRPDSGQLVPFRRGKSKFHLARARRPGPSRAGLCARN